MANVYRIDYGQVWKFEGSNTWLMRAYDNRFDWNLPIRLKSYATANLPASSSALAGALVAVTDGSPSGGMSIAYNTGSAWGNLAAEAASQPLDADLTTIASLTPTTDNFMQAKASAWASRTPTQVNVDLLAANFTPSYTGGVARTLRSLVEERISVESFGADSTGVADSSAAFALADTEAIAQGAKVVVPAGTFRIASNITMVSEVMHEGTLTIDGGVTYKDANPLRFTDYKRRHSTDQNAFGAMLKDAFASTTDKMVLFGEGSECLLTTPVDVATVTGDTVLSQMLEIRGFNLVADPTFPAVPAATVLTGTTTQSSASMTGLSSTATLEVGMLVAGTHVGRETYILSIDSGTTLTLSNPAKGTGSVSYNFTRFQYMLDFSGFTNLSRLVINDNRINGANVASGILLGQDGTSVKIRENYITGITDRAITCFGPIGGLHIDACDITFYGRGRFFAYDTEASGPFLKNETVTFSGTATATAKLVHFVDNGTTGTMVVEVLTGSISTTPGAVDNAVITGGTSGATAAINGDASAQATGIGITTNAADTKIGGTRIPTCLHQLVCSGGGLELGALNHFWGGDAASILLTNRTVKTFITGMEIDNSYIELSDETSNSVTASNAMGDLTIVGNIFTNAASLASERWLVLHPHTASRAAANIIVIGNVFKNVVPGTATDRVDGVNTLDGSIDTTAMSNIVFANNTYFNVDTETHWPPPLVPATSASPYTAEFGLTGFSPFSDSLGTFTYRIRSDGIKRLEIYSGFALGTATLPVEGSRGTDATAFAEFRGDNRAGGADGTAVVGSGALRFHRDGADTTVKAVLELEQAGVPTDVYTFNATDLSINGNIVYRAGGTDVAVADGGSGRSTGATAYGLIAAGTTATGAHQTLAAGALTEVLVGGGASALPVWTTATGTGAPVRATSPTLVTPDIGVASATSVDGRDLSVDGAKLDLITSGVYTPTLFNITNLDGSGAVVCQYLRVGSVVTVSGRVAVNPTAAAATQIDLSLPIASNFAQVYECAGTGSDGNGEIAAISGDTTNDRAVMTFLAINLTNHIMFFSFTYQII